MATAFTRLPLAVSIRLPLIDIQATLPPDSPFFSVDCARWDTEMAEEKREASLPFTPNECYTKEQLELMNGRVITWIHLPSKPTLQACDLTDEQNRLLTPYFKPKTSDNLKWVVEGGYMGEGEDIRAIAREDQRTCERLGVPLSHISNRLYEFMGLACRVRWVYSQLQETYPFPFRFPSDSPQEGFKATQTPSFSFTDPVLGVKGTFFQRHCEHVNPAKSLDNDYYEEVVTLDRWKITSIQTRLSEASCPFEMGLHELSIRDYQSCVWVGEYSIRPSNQKIIIENTETKEVLTFCTGTLHQLLHGFCEGKGARRLPERYPDTRFHEQGFRIDPERAIGVLGLKGDDPRRGHLCFRYKEQAVLDPACDPACEAAALPAASSSSPP